MNHSEVRLVVIKGVAVVFELLLILWYIIVVVQGFLSYGTAYRWTKNGGDNGVVLFAWFFVLALASIVPGLALYFWLKSREI